MRTLTVIPAKLGSTRLPRKNILPLGGKPMIHWIIETALQAGCCGEVMVSTESPEIAEIATQVGATVPFMRPEHLSKDPYEAFHVCEHVLDEYEMRGQTFDTIILLMPTSPFCSVEDIKQTMKVFVEKKAASALTVSMLDKNIFNAHSMDNEGRLMPIFTEWRSMLPSEWPKAYKLNGVVTIASTKEVRKQKTLGCQPAFAYKTDWWRSIDIDTAEDFEYAKYMLNNNLHAQSE